MLFFESRFFLFFAVVFAVHWALHRNGLRKGWLLAASWFFYASWDWRFLGLIVVSTAIDFVAASRIAVSDQKAARRRWLVASLVANLGILGFFKYFDFFVQSGVGVLSVLGLPVEVHTLSLILPVGISFFTFQSMSYTIDVYRDGLAARRGVAGFIDFALSAVGQSVIKAQDTVTLDDGKALLPLYARRMQQLGVSEELWRAPA